MCDGVLELKRPYLRLLTLLVSISLLVSLTGGCQQDGESESRPVKSEKVTIGVTDEPTILNPFLPPGTTQATKNITSSVLWGLLYVTPDLKYAPRLAEEVPTVENGQVKKDPFTVTFNIKEDAVWSDGEPVTSYDLRFTWEMIMNGEYPIADRSGYDKIERIDTPYKKTARIVFKEPYSAYLDLFSTTHPLLPRHLLEGRDFNEVMNDFITFSSGPYKFKNWKRGEQLTLVKNEKFWDKEPYVSEVTFKFVPKTDDLLNKLTDGEIHAAFLTSDRASLESLASNKSFGIKVSPGMLWEHLAFNMSKAPYNDINIRRAIAHVIDKVRLSTEATGEVQVLDSVLVPQQKFFYAPAWSKYDYDLEKSAGYLVKAGYKKGKSGYFEKDGAPLTVAISVATGDPLREEASKLIKADLERAGFKADVKSADPNTFFNSWLPEGNFDVALWAWLSTMEPDFAHMFSATSNPPAGGNYYRYANDDVTSMLKDVSATTDIAERAKLYRSIQAKLSDDLVVIPLYQHPQTLVHNKRVKGIKNNITLEGPFWNLDEWWVAKE